MNTIDDVVSGHSHLSLKLQNIYVLYWLHRDQLYGTLFNLHKAGSIKLLYWGYSNGRCLLQTSANKCCTLTTHLPSYHPSESTLCTPPCYVQGQSLYMCLGLIEWSLQLPVVALWLKCYLHLWGCCMLNRTAHTCVACALNMHNDYTAKREDTTHLILWKRQELFAVTDLEVKMGCIQGM